MIGLHHRWVLHRKIIVRVLAGLLCAFVLALGFHARGGIMQATYAVSNVLSGKFAATGFGIGAIQISGLSVTAEQDVTQVLAIDDHTSTLNFDAEVARSRIEALPAIEHAKVRKIYPGQLLISVVEKKPVARWRVDGTTYLVDKAGEKLGAAASTDDGLPLVIGAGAADNALVMVRAMAQFPMLSEGLVALSRIADRRWDLIYDTGLRVKLPETGIAQALRELQADQRDHQLLDRDLSVVDMRVKDMLTVRLAVHDEVVADQGVPQ